MGCKIAFIVLGWNNRDLLEECIDSIISQTHHSAEIIYVDNNSSDDSVEFLENKYPLVEVIKLNKNTGFAKGNNIGIKRALENHEVKYIALVNTDATLDPHWAETIINLAELKPKGASFQTITLDYYDHRIIDSTHIYVAHNGQATQGSWRRSILSDSDIAPQKTFGCNAAAVVYSRKFIEEQPFDEFFDENMFMYLEDVDVAARATVMGWDNYVVPGARAYHMGSASSGKNPGYSLYMTFRNNSAVLVKNFHFIILVRMLPKLIKGDIETIKTLWKTDRKGAIKKVIKGRSVGLFRLPLFFMKRRRIMKVKSINYRILWRLMLRGF